MVSHLSTEFIVDDSSLTSHARGRYAQAYLDDGARFFLDLSLGFGRIEERIAGLDRGPH